MRRAVNVDGLEGEETVPGGYVNEAETRASDNRLVHRFQTGSSPPSNGGRHRREGAVDGDDTGVRVLAV